MKNLTLSLLFAAVLAQEATTTGETETVEETTTPETTVEPEDTPTSGTVEESNDASQTGEPQITETETGSAEPTATPPEIDWTKAEVIRPVNDFTGKTYFGDIIDGCTDGESTECYCKIQADKPVPHPKPYTPPFFGTNFCHTLSIDSPTCCNKLQDQVVRENWMVAFPDDCLKLTDKNKKFAWLLKDLSCLACKTDQSWFTKTTIKTITPPTYHKVDETCEDQYIEETNVGIKCPRKREVKTKGTYELVEGGVNDNYVVYVCEQFAREIYAGLSEDRQELDLVQLDMIPGGDYDDCSFYKIINDDPDSSDYGDELEEPEEIAFISDVVKNVEDYLNQPGIAVLDQWGIEIKVMYDDMVDPDNPGAESLWEQDENGGDS